MVTLQTSNPTLFGDATQFAQAVAADLATLLALVSAVPTPSYAEITVNQNTSSQTLTDVSTYYQWTTNWTHDIAPSGMTIDTTAGTITVGAACIVVTLCTVNFSANSTDGYLINVFKNGVMVSDHSVVVTMPSASGYSVAATIVGIDDAEAGDVYDVRIQDVSNGGTEVIFNNVNFSVFAIAPG